MINLEAINEELKNQTPHDIIIWALVNAIDPVITTNFRPYEGAILHAVTKVKKDIKVIWCDTGYNTPNTYRHAKDLMALFDLNIHLYVPQQTKGYRDVIMGIPEVDTKAHELFSEQVKLEPFRRAMAANNPDVWFTNLRQGQTAFRDSIGIVSQGKDNVLKISPFYYWSDEELDDYLKLNKIPNEFKYFDPTKVLNNRECGIHN
ncbi:phosphoadenosine phosphosulfate reductase family protein [Putridiphycobacter roseus]|uniref:phosphoadenosine phosphosulfate reductase domain-containing protein n=1 Tax=Putridiphycobacter roseus TaxID=2219161 RepID=UPI0018F237EF|nr:phosphoadenosine phosphosulfate reductase family protein [Putridiphycobacter roseus]